MVLSQPSTCMQYEYAVSYGCPDSYNSGKYLLYSVPRPPFAVCEMRAKCER